MTISQSVLRVVVFCAAATVPAFGQSIHYSYKVNTVAGSYRSGDGGPATSAILEPLAIAPAPDDGFYVGERDGHVRRVTAAGNISTLADLGNTVYSVVLDPGGSIYASTSQPAIYRIGPNGEATLFAGGGVSLGDGIPATSAQFFAISMVFDAAGRLLIADYPNNRIRAIDKNGIITTIAGTGDYGSTGDGGPAAMARLSTPTGIALDGSGNLYIAEYGRIRKVGTDGVIKSIAGKGTIGSNGQFALALNSLVTPDSVAISPDGTVYFTESAFNVVRKIDPDGYLLMVAGSYEPSFGGDDMVATAALLNSPWSIVLDSAGNLLFADYGNARVRRIAAAGKIIKTVAGGEHFAGDGGPATNAVLWQPSDSVYDESGNLYISDYMNRRIRRVSSAGVISTVAGNGRILPRLENVDGTQMAIGYASSLAIDPGGNPMFGEFGGIRRLDRATGKVVTVAGQVYTFGDNGDGGPATSARFGTLSGLAWDKQGNLYVSDQANNRIRRISADNTVNAFAGSGRNAQDGDGAAAASAGIASPGSIAFDSQGNLYILSNGTQIRRVGPDGSISTVLRTGPGTPLDAVLRPVNLAGISFINSIAIDNTDTLYFSIAGGIGALKNGMVWRIAGSPKTGFAGDGGIALNAKFGSAIHLSAHGRTVVAADADTNRVRVLTPLDPTVAEIAGGNNQSGVAGGVLPVALSVRISAAGGLPAALVPVMFAVTAGKGTLSLTSAMTDATGTAQTTLTPGDAGTIKVSATVAGLTPLEFTATATAGQISGPPSIAEGGITGAALSVPPVRSISPNAIVTVWGSNFIAAGTQRRLTRDDLVNDRIPTKLGGICVDFGGQRAPIFDVYPSQLNIQVPAVPGTSVSVRVLRNCGEATESASAPAQVGVADQAPEFFAFSSRADGHVPVAARFNPSNIIVGPTGAYGEPSEPAKPGSIVTVYGTGFGLTTPVAFAPGELPDRASSPAASPAVTLGGVALAPENVLYVGVTPGNAGLYQLNIRIPESVPDGEQPLILKLGTASTPNGPYLLIRRSGGSNSQ